MMNFPRVSESSVEVFVVTSEYVVVTESSAFVFGQHIIDDDFHLFFMRSNTFGFQTKRKNIMNP